MREKVRAALKRREITVEGLARELDLPVSSCHRWLSEEHSPKSASRRKVIAKALKLKESDLWPEE